MNVPDYRRLTQGDVPGMPPAFYKFLDHIQDQLESTSRVLQGRIGLGNILADPPREILLRHGEWQEIKLKNLRQTPRDVRVVFSEEALVGWQWVRHGQTAVRVRALFEGAPSDSIDTTLEILG
jgi:hypothetical protein